MLFLIDDGKIPGTVLDRGAADGEYGIGFLQKIFFVSDGIMLSGIREITGIDGTTLQNWTKRGWVENPHNRKYGIDQLARILLINMLRDSMRMDRIASLFAYLNGRVRDSEEKVIKDSELYDLVCRAAERLSSAEPAGPDALRRVCADVAAGFEERSAGSGRRLKKVLEVILTAYAAGELKRRADKLTEETI